MAEFHSTFSVAADAQEVITYVADLTNLVEWDSSVRAATLAADTGPALGRRFDVTVGFYGKEFEAVYEIVEFECRSAVAWSIDGKASGTGRVTVEPADDGCVVDYRLSVTMSGLAKLLDKGLNVALEGIGENAEQGLQRRFGR